MKRLSAVLLAAGESSRMGDTNKLTLPVKGQALLQRTASTLLKLGLEELIVVTGHEAETPRELLNGYPLKLVYNEHYRDGQMTSVHRGLAELKLPCDAVFVCLADLPLLEIEDLHTIVSALGESGSSIVVPTNNGERGNPVLLDRLHVATILSDYDGLGCRQFIDDHPELVFKAEMSSDSVTFDIDTPEAYDRLMVRLGIPGVSIEPNIKLGAKPLG